MQYRIAEIITHPPEKINIMKFPLLRLPNEIVSRIMEHIPDGKTSLAAMLTCKRIFHLVDADTNTGARMSRVKDWL